MSRAFEEIQILFKKGQPFQKKSQIQLKNTEPQFWKSQVHFKKFKFNLKRSNRLKKLKFI